MLTTLRECLSPIRASVAPQLERGRLWLTRPRDPIDWKTVRTRAGSWLLLNSIASRVVAVVILAVVLVGIIPWLWQIYSTRFPAIIPLGAGIGGAIVAWAALTQAATARRRHEAQTGADLQRRITENFTKAVEQLGSDKLEVRLGGIYSLERISKESTDDYWTVMENLAAFVRERSRRNEAERTSQDLEQRISRRAYLSVATLFDVAAGKHFDGFPLPLPELCGVVWEAEVGSSGELVAFGGFDDAAGGCHGGEAFVEGGGSHPTNGAQIGEWLGLCGVGEGCDDAVVDGSRLGG
jgi:hypothetical protein